MNNMKNVAELLGVELYEEFLVSEHGDNRFWLTETGLWSYNYELNETRLCSTNPSILVNILSNKNKVIKLVQIPKNGETYFYIHTYTPSVSPNAAVIETKWAESFLDLMNYKLGNVFTSRELAEENIKPFKKMLNDSDNFAHLWRNN